MTYKQRIEGLREVVQTAERMIGNNGENSKEYKRYVNMLIDLNEFIGEFIKSGKELNDSWRE